jgi:hypothetical protein
MVTNNDPSDTEIMEGGSTPQVEVPSIIPTKKNQVVDILILCTALFFPLFLASLDTSTSSSVYH